MKQWHLLQGFEDPTVGAEVQKTMKGIRRIHGRAKITARPLELADLAHILAISDNSKPLAKARDKALLLVGFFGAFRRSELLSIEFKHLNWVSEGVEILIPRSKTDKENNGAICALAFSGTKLCPVQALKDWLNVSAISRGFIFRPINKGGILGTTALSPQSINLLLKTKGRKAGLKDAERLSGHSFRRGLATTASKQGIPLTAIMRQGRWQSSQTVMGYIDEGSRFRDNMVSLLSQAMNETSR